MRTLQLHYKYSYKYKLLYCLLLNYYRRCYSKNKFKGVIAVACFKRPILMNHYEMFFKTINEFTVDDIHTLRKFIFKLVIKMFGRIKFLQKFELKRV